MRVAAIVLAAGSSRRMGANKLLLPVEGEPMIRRVVGRVLAAGADPVIVVLGHQSDEVLSALAGLAVVPVLNPRHADGMASSLRVGIAAVPADRAFLVALGDMPWVRVDTIGRLIAAAAPGMIAVPVHAGARGNPTLWDPVFRDELLAVSGDVGGRAIIAARPDKVLAIPVDDPGALRDVDLPPDVPPAP